MTPGNIPAIIEALPLGVVLRLVREHEALIEDVAEQTPLMDKVVRKVRGAPSTCPSNAEMAWRVAFWAYRRALREHGVISK